MCYTSKNLISLNIYYTTVQNIHILKACNRYINLKVSEDNWKWRDSVTISNQRN